MRIFKIVPKSILQKRFLPLFIFMLCAAQLRAAAPLSYEIPAEYTPPADAAPLPRMPDGPARNVILMIGDGMGPAQVALGRLAQGKGAAGRLHLDRMPVVGIQFTYPDAGSGIVTDSAASATAMASGVKTTNHMLGLLPDGRLCRSIAELSHAAGRGAGLVVTCRLSHATPAGFVAHAPDRGQDPLIASQMASSGFEVLLGGGMNFFAPHLDAMRTAGYDVATTRDAMAAAQGGKLIGVFAPDLLDDRRTTQSAMLAKNEPTLAAMTDKAIEILSRDPDGFFLMVEGSQIDMGGHDNSPERVVRHMLGFDAALARALAFAASRTDTLVVVTADHETGGLSLPQIPGPMPPGSPQSLYPDIKWGSRQHTALPVQVYAFGGGADAFTGTYDNTDLAKKLAKALSLGDFPKIEAAPAQTPAPTPTPTPATANLPATASAPTPEAEP